MRADTKENIFFLLKQIQIDTERPKVKLVVVLVFFGRTKNMWHLAPPPPPWPPLAVRRRPAGG